VTTSVSLRLSTTVLTNAWGGWLASWWGIEQETRRLAAMELREAAAKAACRGSPYVSSSLHLSP